MEPGHERVRKFLAAKKKTRILRAVTTSQCFVLLVEKIHILCNLMEIPDLSKTKDVQLCDILNAWIGKLGKHATVGALMDILEEAGLKDWADNIASALLNDECKGLSEGKQCRISIQPECLVNHTDTDHLMESGTVHIDNNGVPCIGAHRCKWKPFPSKLVSCLVFLLMLVIVLVLYGRSLVMLHSLQYEIERSGKQNQTGNRNQDIESNELLVSNSRGTMCYSVECTNGKLSLRENSTCGIDPNGFGSNNSNSGPDKIKFVATKYMSKCVSEYSKQAQDLRISLLVANIKHAYFADFTQSPDAMLYLMNKIVTRPVKIIQIENTDMTPRKTNLAMKALMRSRISLQEIIVSGYTWPAKLLSFTHRYEFSALRKLIIDAEELPFVQTYNVSPDFCNNFPELRTLTFHGGIIPLADIDIFRDCRKLRALSVTTVLPA